MKDDNKKPYSLTPATVATELTELEKIKAKMLSDVAVALIGCCDAYPDARHLAEDAKRIVEICFGDGEEVEK